MEDRRRGEDGKEMWGKVGTGESQGSNVPAPLTDNLEYLQYCQLADTVADNQSPHIFQCLRGFFFCTKVTSDLDSGLSKMSEIEFRFIYFNKSNLREPLTQGHLLLRRC